MTWDTARSRRLAWVILAALAAAAAYVVFQAYLAPDSILWFSNWRMC